MCGVLYVDAAEPIHKLYLIMTKGLLGFFPVKSQRDQLLLSLSTALDFSSTLPHGRMSADGWIYGYLWAWVLVCGGRWELHLSVFHSVCVGVCVK